MSQFGYGTRFEPQPVGPMPHPRIDSRSTNVPRNIPGVNFNPDPTTPAAMPDQYLWGYERSGPHGNDLAARGEQVWNQITTGSTGRETTPIYEYKPWDSPTAKYFGGAGAHQNLQGPDSKRHAIGGTYQGDENTQLGFTPRNSKDLYNQMGNLTPENLKMLNQQGLGDLQNRFQRTAQGYSNLYANEAYGTTHLDGFSGMGQKENQMYLQAAYNRLMRQMDENFLL